MGNKLGTSYLLNIYHVPGILRSHMKNSFWYSMNFVIKKVNNPIIGTRIVHLKQSENNKRFSSVRSISVSNIVITLPINLQVVNFQRCECMFHQCQAWVKLQLALHLLLLQEIDIGSFSSTISHFLSVLQSVTFLACSLKASRCMPAAVLYYCTFQGTVS